MKFFTAILTDLRAAIAARAARDRALAVLLVAVWGRVARMGTRLERFIAQWRAGTLPPPRASRAGRASAPRTTARFKFPRGRAWLIRHVPEAVAFGTQLAHHMSDAESQAFLAAVPQAGRILRPLLRMLGVETLPDLVAHKVKPAVPAPAPVAEMVGIVGAPVAFFLAR